MKYFCKRCGYKTNIKCNLITHFQRKKPCKPILSNINTNTLLSDIQKNGQNTDNNDENTDKNGQIIEKDNENISKKKNYNIVNGKYQCKECKKLFEQVRYLDDHLKRYCKMTTAYNNIYKYNTKTFGKTKYGKNGGDVYIIGQHSGWQDKHFYKIGVTVNIYQRMRTYRCGLAIEPRLHYYYPFKDIKKADKDLKFLLCQHWVKREIYKGDLDILRNIIKKYQQEQDNNISEFIPEIKDESYIYKELEAEKLENDKIAILKAEMAQKEAEMAQKEAEMAKIIEAEIAQKEAEMAQKEAEMAQKEAEMAKIIEAEIAQKEAAIAKVIEEKEKEKEEIKELMRELMEEKLNFIHKQMELLMKNPMNNTTNNNNNTNNTNNTDNSTNIDNKQINIHINGFGKEDLSYITDRHFREWFNGPFSAIPNLVEYIHFNPKKPQNWNAKISDDKTSKALIYNAEKEMWVKREKKEVINDMIEKSYNMLDTNFEIQKEAKTLDEKGKRKFENFMNIYDKGDKQLDKRYETEVREKLLNYKEYMT